MKKITKLFVALLIALLSPIIVKAAGNLTINQKSYDKDTYEFVVSGTSDYEEVMVSLFDGEDLLSFKTVSTNNNSYTATFDITFEQDKTITIKVGDINSTDYEIDTLDVEKSETHLNNILTDENGNQLVIKGANAQFRNNERLRLMMLSKEELEEQVEQAQGTEAGEEATQVYNIIKLALGNKELVEFLQIRVEDDMEHESDYNSHMAGFTLKINIDKDTYNALGEFEVAQLNMENGLLGDPLTYSYDEEEEILTINIEKPGILLAYKKQETTTEKENVSSPKTGDSIMKSVLILGISVTGLVGAALVLKKNENSLV